MQSGLSEKDKQDAGWGCLIVLLVLALVISFVLQFFGSQWFWPWIFLAGLVAIVLFVGRRNDAKKES